MDLFKSQCVVYFPITVNGLSTHAFVDTGRFFGSRLFEDLDSYENIILGAAQTSLSLSFANKCEYESKIDTRHRNTLNCLAGRKRISGKIHLGKFTDSYF